MAMRSAAHEAEMGREYKANSTACEALRIDWKTASRRWLEVQISTSSTTAM